MATAVYLEAGEKKVFASALEWPGWCRSGKSEDEALEALAEYASRYAPVPKRAKISFPKGAANSFDVVERVKGSMTTDFGAPGAPASADERALTKAAAERLASLVEASWALLDDVVAGAPAVLKKGPRGGGRDRDKMFDHVIDGENSYARKIGVRFTPTQMREAGLAAFRHEIVAALRAARKPRGDDPKGWPYRYAARRIAWHTLDHAWEMEDKSGR